MIGRFAIVQICDDARFDQQGCLNITGQYISETTVERTPIFLPKLTFVVRLRSSATDRPREFKVRIEPFGREPIIHDASGACLPDAPTDGGQLSELLAIFTLSPFEISTAGKISVYVMDELAEYYAGSLNVKIYDPETPNPQVVGGELLHRWALLPDGMDAADRKELAERMLDIFSKMAIKNLPSLRRVQDVLFLPFSKDTVVVIFAAPMRAPPNVKLNGLPPNVRYEIKKTDRFSAEIYFPDIDGSIPNFEIVLDSRL
ncbi:hypothetical protein FV219_01515 [Methylobacterium sp. WL122]|nr:hypothetical protein FV219_01515 [Methylobacterium sp. WL122]